MRRLVVINSLGPMASTLLAGLIEKLGYTNVPLRKLRLHQYLMGNLAIDSGVMQQRLRSSIENHHKKILSGGVSVLDRDGQSPKSLVDLNLVKEQLDDMKAANIEDLYHSCRSLYCKAVVYKAITSNPEWQIELTVDVQAYDPEALFARYESEFECVRMIHLHRPFDKWINSLSSQSFMHPSLKRRILFFPHLRYADYLKYEAALKRMPGMHLEFDDLFNIPIEELATKLASYLDVEDNTLNLRNEIYDLYGKLVPYSIAFTRFDDNVKYLSPKTLKYLIKKASDGTLRKPVPAFTSWVMYLRDMLIFRMKRSALV